MVNADQPSVALEQIPDNDTRVETLKQELRAKEEYLHATNEELETSNEELKSSNEEMQSVNEELQSTNEELETSKEELQSVNEELATVNAELQTKVIDLSQANNDMNNLLAGTGIATVFVDHYLHITRFTPAATHIINLILSDIGRPVAHTVTNLKNYASLVTDTQKVLDTLIPKEVEVQTQTGEWYVLRIQPYRTTDNVIEGAVITFVNITGRKREEDALRESENKYRTLLDNLSSGVVVHGPDSGILSSNAMASSILGLQLEQMQGKMADDPRWTFCQEDGSAMQIKDFPVNRVLASGEAINNQVLGFSRPDRAERTWVLCNAYCIKNAEGQIEQVVVTFNDITEKKQADDALRKADELLRLAVVIRDVKDAILLQDLKGHIIAWNPGAVRLYGWSEVEALSMNMRDLIPEDLREDALSKIHQLSQAAILEPYFTKRITRDDRVVEVSITASALLNESGQMYAITTTERAHGVERKEAQ